MTVALLRGARYMDMDDDRATFKRGWAAPGADPRLLSRSC